MEEHLAARPKPRDDVLEIRHGRRGAAQDCGIERTAAGSEQPERKDAAADLEALVVDVLVRHLVTRHVEQRPEEQSERPGADERAQCAAGRDVQRDDHRAMIAYALGVSFLDRVRSWLSGPTRIQADGAEERADLKEEFGASDEGRHDIDRMQHGYAGGAPVPGLAGRESAEIAESEIESEEAPPSPGT
jgi:hypothetical protein